MMLYELFLAWRYLRAPHGRMAARWVTRIAVLGIGTGVGALIFALALANGFRDAVRDSILRSADHITLMRTDGGSIGDWRALVARLRAVKGVRRAHATAYTGALLEGSEAISPAVLRALDAETETERPALVAGSFAAFYQEHEPTPLVVGEKLAERIGAQVGDVVALVVARGETLDGIEPRMVMARVVGIFRSGLFEYDASWVYVPLGAAIEWTGAPSVIGLEVDDPFNVAAVEGEVRRVLGQEFSTVNWQEANRPFFAALAFERRLVALLIALLIGVAATNVFAALSLTVAERRADIAMLRVMGASAASVHAIFIAQGLLIGCFGVALGAVSGLGACALGNRFGLIRLPADVYSINAVPLHPRVSDVLMTAAVALIICLAASVGPARGAQRHRPAVALRNE